MNRLGRLVTGVALASLLSFRVGAQSIEPDLTGRLDSAWMWSEGEDEPLAGASGWVGLTAGTPQVKAELRLGLNSLDEPTVGLRRAWVKFRLPGVRFTTGLGRLAWGPGLVYVPADLLFDASGATDWNADELRSDPAWVADAWVPLGDEAFVEASARSSAAGLRVSAAPFGVTLEAAGVWDHRSRTVRTALSTQFHAGADWYASVRQDLPFVGPARRWSADNLQASVGAFGMVRLAEGWTLTSRHESLSRGFEPWAGPATYHDLSVSVDDWVLTTRAFAESWFRSWTPSAELGWSGLPNLMLRVGAGLSEPRTLNLGASAWW